MVIFSREWAMPSGDTLSIPPIRRLFEKYRPKGDSVIVDPFARNCKLGTIRNDLNPEFDTQYHLDALEFLKTLKEDSADMVVFDPPYSVAQAASIYKSYGKEKLEINVANAKYWSMCRKHISRILKNGGVCLSCGWNTNGVGKENHAELLEVLLVAHGGMHNDTLVTVERINKNLLFHDEDF